MKTFGRQIVIGGLYCQVTPPPFFHGVRIGASLPLKANKHDAAVLLLVKKENADERRKEAR